MSKSGNLLNVSTQVLKSWAHFYKSWTLCVVVL